MGDLDLDDPQTTEQRLALIRRKPFLEAIYREWYDAIAHDVRGERVVELGSGAGFLREHLPRAITSEVFFVRHVDLVFDARALPLRSESIDALVLVDVLHHVPDARAFFGEAVRALRRGGRVVMIEPWVTPWSRLIYSNFHHEPFRPAATTWEFASTGPLSGANGALPWILFDRDRAQFEKEFPALRIESIAPLMPLRYLLSGGLSMPSLVPSWTFKFFRAIDRALARPMAMFAKIVVEKSS